MLLILGFLPCLRPERSPLQVLMLLIMLTIAGKRRYDLRLLDHELGFLRPHQRRALHALIGIVEVVNLRLDDDRGIGRMSSLGLQLEFSRLELLGIVVPEKDLRQIPWLLIHHLSFGR